MVLRCPTESSDETKKPRHHAATPISDQATPELRSVREPGEHARNGQQADVSVLELAVAEEQQGWNTPHVEPRREFRRLAGVDGKDSHLVAMLLRQSLEHGSEKLCRGDSPR
jgi:hypothetical protein